MSGFSNATNKNRVQKILEILALIEKSATSNSASAEEVNELLAPVLKSVEVPEPEPSPNQRSNPDSEERPGMIIKRAAEEASLKDLTYALAVYLNRIDEHLD